MINAKTPPASTRPLIPKRYIALMSAVVGTLGTVLIALGAPAGSTMCPPAPAGVPQTAVSQ